MSPERLRIPADEVVLAVTSALIVIVPSTVPIQVLVDVAVTVLLIVNPVCAPIAIYEEETTRGELIVADETFIAYPSGLSRVRILPPLNVRV